MLSIVIPIYNTDCSVLIDQLLLQVTGKVPFEIICIDDASTQEFTPKKDQTTHPNIRFLIQNVNLGRSSIRNLLVEKSTYPWILFLDGDTLPASDSFISDYLKALKNFPDLKIFFGGISYRQEDLLPENHLRFKFGSERESIPVFKREKKPYISMLMSNTLIHKSVFDKVSFNPNIKEYGYEDTVFSFDLYKHGYFIKHIHNPLYHLGVESNTIFISKTKIAVENLIQLYNNKIIKPAMNKMLQKFLILRKFGISFLVAKFYLKFESYFEKKLNQNNPTLFVFDIFRLSYLCFIYHKKK